MSGPSDAVPIQTWAGVRTVPAKASPEARQAARKTALYGQGDMLLMWVNEGDLMVADMAARRAATALEAKDRRIADQSAILREVASYDPSSDPAGVRLGIVMRSARAALEPSDKGVGR